MLVTGVEDPDTRAHGANEGLHLAEFERVCLAETLLLVTSPADRAFDAAVDRGRAGLMRSVAEEVINPRFRSLSDDQIAEKRPGDLVTVADHEAEQLLTAALLEAYPEAVVLGEEHYAEAPDLLERFRAAAHAFTVDPVDGTKNFVQGSPDHAVMISEVVDGLTTRGWIWQPQHEVAWVAELGGGVRRNGEPVRRTPAGEQPQGATSIWSRRGRQPVGLPALRGSWVCCGVDYPHLIEGDADFLLYGHTNPWDHLPGTLMLAEAGGASAHRDGSAYSARSTSQGLVVAADAATLERVLVATADLWPRPRGGRPSS